VSVLHLSRCYKLDVLTHCGISCAVQMVPVSARYRRSWQDLVPLLRDLTSIAQSVCHVDAGLCNSDTAAVISMYASSVQCATALSLLLLLLQLLRLPQISLHSILAWPAELLQSTCSGSVYATTG
jgi:hypothetical protein